MSMICTLRSVSEETLARAAKDPSILEDDEDAGELDLEKAWHGVHYLLTGQAWGGGFPMSFLVEGGAELDDDLGYGPSRVFTREQVRAIAKALDAVEEKTLRARFDPGAMDAETVYPAIWARDGEAALAWLLEAFEEVRSFVATAAEADQALIVELS